MVVLQTAEKMKFLDNHIIGAGKRRTGEKGVALILVVISLVFFLVFFLIFLDFAYVYFVRGQLQNAADAAALAGIAKTKSGDCLVLQSDAEDEAQEFASKNFAAGEAVMLTDDGTNNSASDDTIFGRWDRDTRVFTSCFDDDSVSVNAIRVVARRTQNRPTGRFGILFGQIFNMTSMKIGVNAIAETGGGAATLPLPLCLDAVEQFTPPPSCTVPVPAGTGKTTDFTSPSCPGKKYALQPGQVPAECGVGWANLNDPLKQNPSAADVREYINNLRHVNLCDPQSCMMTSQGGMPNLLGDLRDVAEFSDATDVNGDPIVRSGETEPIQGWKVLIPILRGGCTCDGDSIDPSIPCPGAQGANPEPYSVMGMAEAIVTKIDDKKDCDSPGCYEKNTFGIVFIGAVPTTTPNTTRFRVLRCDNPDDVEEIDALAGRSRLVQ